MDFLGRSGYNFQMSEEFEAKMNLTDRDAEAISAYSEATPSMQQLWLGLLVFGEDGISIDDLTSLFDMDTAGTQDLLTSWSESGAGVVEKKGLWLIEAELSLFARAYFHEELVQLLLSQGRLKQAMDALYRSVLVHQLTGDLAGQADDLGNIGALLLRADHIEQAEKMFEEALVLHLKMDDEIGQASDWANLGITSFRMERLDETRKRLETAIRLFERAGADEMAERTRQNLQSLDE